MEPSPSFEPCSVEFRRFREAMDRSLDKIEAEPAKQQVQQLIDGMNRQCAQVQEAISKAIAEIRDGLAQAYRGLDTINRQVIDLQTQFTARSEAALSPPPQEPPAVLPEFPRRWGFKLWDELIARFGPPIKDERVSRLREIWEDWIDKE